jgi:hypothetical protein
MNGATERLVCTKENPWTPDSSAMWLHPEAKDDGECMDGCCDYYLCPICKLRFRVEVPQ